MTAHKLHDTDKSDIRARELAARLSLEEKVSLLAGADFWRTVPLPHRGIPSIKTTDGPNGARGQYFKNGTPAALFPCGVSLAATWNLDLIHEVGQHLAAEAKARGANVLLAPTVCMHRSPLGGRNFESFSEDPFLTGKLAAAYIRGLQSNKVAATIKHFVCNEQETHRMNVDSVIQERPLREIYLKPFEIALRESSPWALMSSYNLLNGVHADMNEFTLKKVLRDEWKYDGQAIVEMAVSILLNALTSDSLVMSDWTGTNSTVASIQAGCDLEMPGPTEWRGKYALAAVANGELSPIDIERSAGNVLHLIERTKGLNGPIETPERAVDNPYTRDLIRQAGVEGITLLKNESNILPIKNSRTIAVIGPNAKRAIAGGGGSASLHPYYTTTPFDGIQAATSSMPLYAQGCDTSKWLPPADPFCETENGADGVTLEFFRGDSFQGDPMEVQHKQTTELFLWDSAPVSVLPVYSFKVKTILYPKTTGRHTISFRSVGPGRLFVNNQLFIDNWDWTEEGEAMFEDSKDIDKEIYLEEGQPVRLLVESTNEVRPAAKISVDGVGHKYGGCRIGYQEESRVDLLKEAIDVAKAADVAVVVVGLDGEWESEGYDRHSMDLPKNGSQDRLIEAILKANPNTIVVNQSGSPVTMPWADKVPAILQAWYQGQEAGNALADVLFGRQSPSGKTPTTFPRRLEDNPTYHNWPGENLKVVYGEGIYVGYRHYERMKIQPLFPFGHGLTYTTFHYGTPTISSTVMSESDTLFISIPITNTGDVVAPEIVQAYVRDINSKLPRPSKELQAFAKVMLQPGETKSVELLLNKYSVGYYDTSIGSWLAEEGSFEVLIGASSADIRCTVAFDVKESFTWIF